MSVDSFDPTRAQQLVDLAAEIAERNDHEYVTLEHLLAAVIQDERVLEVLNEIGANASDLSANLVSHFQSGVLGKAGGYPPRQTAALIRVVQRAVGNAMFSGRRVIRPVDILISILGEEDDDCHAKYFLAKQNIDGFDVKTAIAHDHLLEEDADESSDSEKESGEDASSEEGDGGDLKNKKSKSERLLEKFCINLNDEAAGGKIDPLIGREAEVDSLILTTARRTKNNVVLVGEPGVGKAQPLSSMIKIPGGWVTMGEIKVGDQVSRPDGGVAKVVGIFPQGIRDVYEVSFKDGRKVRCDIDHLWKVKSSRTSSEYEILSLRTLLYLQQFKSFGKWKVPLAYHEETENKNLPLDPYLVGLLLGDGCQRSEGSGGFTSADSEIIDSVKELLPEGTEIIQCADYDYKFVGTGDFKHKRSEERRQPFLNYLDNLSMRGKRSWEKEIPAIYMSGSLSQKLALIQGLMDTDGHVGGNGALSFTTTSPKMAQQFRELIWSIGGIASIRSKKPSYPYRGQKRTGKLAYTISVRYRNPQDLVRLSRKKSLIPRDYQYSETLSLEITDIEKVGTEPTQCILLDSQDHLYLTDNFVVTHNTAIVEGFAKMIVEDNVPSAIAGSVVYSLNIGALMAGTKFRGDMEERVKQIIDAVEVVGEEKGILPILFIDEIHTMMGAGAGSGGALDVANLLKPALAKGKLRCIGGTTYEEYRKHFEKDRALLRRFQKLDVPEPSIEDSKRILAGLAETYQNYHGIKYEAEALDAAVDLTARYVTDRMLPDKAIDVIDAAGARQKILPDDQKAEIITVDLIENEVSRIAKIPARTVKEDENEKLARLHDDLHAVVFGQDQAIEVLTDAVILSRAGLRDPNKPLGNYLFAGPTGVGKTELSKQLSNTMSVPLVRFDMSEYMEKHSVSKFIGSPPGYVGFGDGQAGSGLLTNAIENSPHCVLLIDEIEKAHPDIFNVFLQIMDNGQLTNSSGRTINFRNVILIMTTNAGAAELQKNSLGFGANSTVGNDDKVIEQMFAPEFRNRLDAIVKFNALKRENMIRIVEKMLDQLNKQANEKNVVISVDEMAKEYLASKGYDPKMGARPLSRLIQNEISKPLSRLMLFGSLKSGGTVNVTVVENELIVG